MNAPAPDHHILRTTLLPGILLTAILLTAFNTHAQQPEQNTEQNQTLNSNNIILRAIGGQPNGTHIGRMRHMDWSYIIASPIPFKNTHLTGFSYSERGGVLTQLFTILTLTALSPEAGLSFAFEMPPDTLANFGLTIEYLSANNDHDGNPYIGTRPYHFTLKLNHAFALTGRPLSLQQPPITLTWGLQLQIWSRPHNIATSSYTDGASLGLPLEFAFPLTRWAQIDANLTILTLDMPFEIAAGTTFHLGNRFFLAAGSTYTFHHFGPYFRAGARL